MEELAPGLWTHGIVAEGFPTTCAVVFTDRWAFVVDTLTSPDDMEPVLDLLAEQADERRLIVVNTHHHWDHVYGNAAFAGLDIVAQQACPRLLQAQLRSADESLCLPPDEGVPLPAITFGDRLMYDDRGETVHLIHTPGHTEDSLVVYLASARVLLGGDTVEWPLPNFAQRGGIEAWVRTLRQLKQLPVDTVIPSHGPVMSKEIIDANERYLAGVQDMVAGAKRHGAGRGDLSAPLQDFLAPDVELDDVYAGVHRENLIWMWDEV